MDKQNLSFRLKLCLVCSAFLNLLFLYFLISDSSPELSWSRKASKEAEAVGSLSCSGHGQAHLDGLLLDGGKPVCECNGCYTGPDCSHFVPDCVVDADRFGFKARANSFSVNDELNSWRSCLTHFFRWFSGNPIFLEPFWRQNAEKSAIMVAGWHRMGYEFEDGSLISKQLEKQIRILHDTVGNTVTDERYIVFGAGSTQLLNAAVHALSTTDSSSSPAKVVASVPYYPVSIYIESPIHMHVSNKLSM